MDGKILLDALFSGKLRGGQAPLSRCLACGAPGTRGLCNPCFRSLPWNDHACPVCAGPLPLLPTPVCGGCLRRPPPFDATYAAFQYAWPADRLLHQFKFGGRLATGRVLAMAFVDYLRMRSAPAPDLLVPVPLHRKRLARRGFNQAAELARVLGPALGVPVRPLALRRTRATVSQLGLGRRARRGNLRGAFQCTTPLADLHVGVVDDVVTTTATVSEIARSLRRAGVTRVSVYAVARA